MQLLNHVLFCPSKLPIALQLPQAYPFRSFSAMMLQLGLQPLLYRPLTQHRASARLFVPYRGCCRPGLPLLRPSQAAADVHAAAADADQASSPAGVQDPAGESVPSNNGRSQQQGAVAAPSGPRGSSPSWESTGDETDWEGQKPFSWRDIDWGLASLVGVILLLSFGAYRVLNFFSVYQHTRRPNAPQITTLVQRPAAGSSSSTPSPSTSAAAAAAAPAAATTAAAPSSSKSKPSRARKAKQSKQQAGAGASEAGTAAPEATAAAGGGAAAGAAAAATSPAGPSFELPAAAGVPGAPQPSPLDAGFSSSMPGPWATRDLGQLDLAPLPPLLEPTAPLQPPELPSIQVEPPAKAVTAAELAALPNDPSLPSLRERAHIAMRASGAAMEASQRAAAYSAAASSAASRAAEAAERAAAAAATVQGALERAADDAMSEAVKRMNRAVEMVADAESRAAAAAAMATAYQDISDSQAAAAEAAADLPAMPQPQGPVGHMANLQQVLHGHLFTVRAVLGDWAAGIWAAVVGAFAAVQAVLAAAGSKVVGVFGGSSSGPGSAAAGASS